eukprot:8204592-Heterocapsa_arctica.AAC.1
MYSIRGARDLVVTELNVDSGVRNREYGSSCAQKAGSRRLTDREQGDAMIVEFAVCKMLIELDECTRGEHCLQRALRLEVLRAVV